MTAGGEVETRRYTVFGLIMDSEIELPELAASAHVGHADISVRLAPVGKGQGLAGDGGYIHRVPDVGAYLVAGGTSILVDPEPAAHESHVRLFLLGTALGIALHQRGLLPLHANGIEIEGRAVLFMGASGAGKSTLASWFVGKGHRLLADDVCAVTIADGQPRVLPGVPRFRLWEDALARQGLSLDGLSLSYAGDETYRKFDVPVGSDARVGDCLPLGGIYVLERGERNGVTPLAGMTALEQLYAHTYRGEYVARLGLREPHLRMCSLLANDVPMFAAVRLWGPARMELENEALLEHALGLALGIAHNQL